MQKELTDLVVKLLIETANKIKDGRCALQYRTLLEGYSILWYRL